MRKGTMKAVRAASLTAAAGLLLVLTGCSLPGTGGVAGVGAPPKMEVEVVEPVSAGAELELPSFAMHYEQGEDDEFPGPVGEPFTFDEVAFDVVERLPEGIGRADLYRVSYMSDDSGRDIEFPCEVSDAGVPEDGWACLKMHVGVTNPGEREVELPFEICSVALFDADAEPGIIDRDGEGLREGVSYRGEGAYLVLGNPSQAIWASPGENFTVTSRREAPVRRELYPFEQTSFELYYLLPKEDLENPDLCWLVEPGVTGEKVGTCAYWVWR